MWGQPKISSCCLCVWCKSKELGGKESGVRGGKIPNINGGNLLRRFSVTYRKFLDKYQNFVKYQRRIFSAKICGASLDD